MIKSDAITVGLFSILDPFWSKFALYLKHMTRATLRDKHPDIAESFEEILKMPLNAKKYRFLAYNYRYSKRGVSLEKIAEVLDENGVGIGICPIVSFRPFAQYMPAPRELERIRR